jgi:hypothetical protein
LLTVVALETSKSVGLTLASVVLRMTSATMFDVFLVSDEMQTFPAAVIEVPD